MGNSETGLRATASFDGTVRGSVTFTQLSSGGCEVVGSLQGLSKGLHGMHVHEHGATGGACAAAGDHFDPTHSHHHGGAAGAPRHAGDFGNIQASSRGTSFRFTQPALKLSGPLGIVGRTLVIHENADDMGKGRDPESRKSGNSGKRIACAIIGWS